MTILVLLLALSPFAAADACKADAASLCPKTAGPERVRCLEGHAAKRASERLVAALVHVNSSMLGIRSR